MSRRLAAAAAALLAAGCACRPCRPCPPCPPSSGRTGAPPAVALPAAPPPSPVSRALARPRVVTPAERLGTAAKAPDPVSALLALARKAPDVLRDAPEEAWAPLLSDRVRLVDLREVAQDGGDAPPHALGPSDAPSREGDAAIDPRVERIARTVRDALGKDAWDERGTLLALRPWGLVVVQSPERFLDVEKALDRSAVAGGPLAQVAVLVTEDADGLGRALGIDGGGWRRTDPARTPEVAGLEPAPPTVPPAAVDAWSTPSLDAAAWARAEALAAVPPLRLPLRGDRRVAAGRTSRTAYVQDYDVEIPPSSTSTIVGTLVEGTTSRGWREEERWHVELVRGQALRPIPTFETRLADGARQEVRIEVPGIRVFRVAADLAPSAGAAVYARGAGGARTACLFRVESAEEGTPVRPAWRWWRSAPAPTVPFGSRGGHGWPLSLRIERPARDGGSEELVGAPSLLLTEGEEGVVTSKQEESYVGSVTVFFRGDASFADPVVRTLATGLEVSAKVTPLPDGSAVVEGRLTVEDRDRPIRTLTTLLGPGAPVSVQLPRTWRTDVPFRARMRPGDTVGFPAAARTSRGLEHLRVRLSLAAPIRLFTPWPRERS